MKRRYCHRSIPRRSCMVASTSRAITLARRAAGQQVEFTYAESEPRHDLSRIGRANVRANDLSSGVAEPTGIPITPQRGAESLLNLQASDCAKTTSPLQANIKASGSREQRQHPVLRHSRGSSSCGWDCLRASSMISRMIEAMVVVRSWATPRSQSSWGRVRYVVVRCGLRPCTRVIVTS